MYGFFNVLYLSCNICLRFGFIIKSYRIRIYNICALLKNRQLGISTRRIFYSARINFIFLIIKNYNS